eukprot:CAMPEP_0198139240 /NCGR_PEP_ID=MMETSP1443-20131203/2590_1 /TAXON_ID=186043 /ORGANISM="Entomoneis sp., Strain CCMP2396" /LENGTH=179 /DNA_ID=CAMNT_0043801317 /DNA_START=236 /DNA_END=775 /DNA_ORIENTATION=-
MGHSKDQQSDESYDIYRDSLVRYLGYANEVGESFRYQFPRFVTPSYVIAFGYCAADSISKGYSTWTANPEAVAAEDSTRIHDTARATLDTLMWQSLASVAIPGATINTIVKASRWAIRRSSPMVVLPALAIEWIPTAMGLGSIPLIIRPIDEGVDYLMDHTARKIWPETKKIPAISKSD